MVDFSTSVLAVRGCRIRLMRAGAGSPLVVLHGASGANVLPFMQQLAQKFDVIAPEHPGFGESDTPDWLDNIHDLAYFYLDLLDELKLRGREPGRAVVRRLDRRGARRAQHATACLAHAGRLRRSPCRRRRAARSVPAQRRAAAARLLLRSEKGQRHRCACAAAGAGRRHAEEPHHGRKDRVAAARPRPESAQMAAPHRRADLADLGRPRPRVPQGARVRLSEGDPRCQSGDRAGMRPRPADREAGRLRRRAGNLPRRTPPYPPPLRKRREGQPHRIAP